MMQFYKKRDFGAFISDTFVFFKEHGRNYFKNYFMINGVLLIFMVAFFIIGYREFISPFLGTGGGQSAYFETYFQENQALMIFSFILLFVLFFVITMVSYLFPVFYMKRVSETGNKNIRTDEMISDFKNNIGRFMIFFLGSLFIVLPLIMVAFGITALLMMILIGFLLIFLLGPAILNVVNFMMFDYFHTKKGFFESLSYSIRAQFSYKNGREKSPFWKYWGATTSMYFILQVISSIFTMIPLFVMMFFVFTNPNAVEMQQNPFEGPMGIFIFSIYGFSILFSFVMMNLMFVNSGLQYYDSRTDLHRTLDLNEIDLIGTNEI